MKYMNILVSMGFISLSLIHKHTYKYFIEKNVNNLLKHNFAGKAVNCIEASSDRVDLNSLKSLSPGSGWGYNGGGSQFFT